MRDIIRNITLRSVAGIILVMMLLLIANKGLFLHTHHFADGTVITHAHPFSTHGNEAPEKSHKHSKNDLEIIHHFDEPIVLSIFSININIEVVDIQYFSINILDYSPQTVKKGSGRSPPVA